MKADWVGWREERLFSTICVDDGGQRVDRDVESKRDDGGDETSNERCLDRDGVTPRTSNSVRSKDGERVGEL